MNKPLMQSRFGKKYQDNFDLIFKKKKLAKYRCWQEYLGEEKAQVIEAEDAIDAAYLLGDEVIDDDFPSGTWSIVTESVTTGERHTFDITLGRIDKISGKFVVHSR